MNKNIQNKEGGFLRIIFIIVILLLIMSYFHITFTGIIHWIINTIKNVI